MLTAKQKRFCEEFLIDLNATQAAIRAGYSKNTAAEQSSRLLINVNIQEYISERQKSISESLKISAEMVVNELKALGFYNIQDFVDDTQSLINISEASRDILKPVVGIKVTERFVSIGEATEKIVTTEFKLADKRAALVDIGKHLGIFEKDNNQKTVKIKVTRT